jgi:hypothetical protein
MPFVFIEELSEQFGQNEINEILDNGKTPE